jgi:hypothetical protein
MADEDGLHTLYEVLREVQLEQFYGRIKDELQVCVPLIGS